MRVFGTLLFGTCLSFASAARWACSFSTPTSGANAYWCGMSRSSGSRWRVTTGGTPSFGTGPSSGASGSSTDRYAYIEASGGGPTTSYLQTPTLFPSSQNGAILQFSYHMYGATMGALSVQTCVATSCTTRWRLAGRQLNFRQNSPYNRTYVNLPAGTTTVRFVGVKGRSFTSDMAIDDILVTTGTSLPPTAAPTSTPPCQNLASGAMFAVTAAVPEYNCVGGGGPSSAQQGTCYTTSAGTCFTDGPGNHGNNERCTIAVRNSGYLSVVGTLQLEACCDYFTITGSNTRRNTFETLNGYAITAGQTISWRSDSSATRSGFTICAASTMPPSPAPPPPVTAWTCGFNSPTSGELTQRVPSARGVRFWCGAAHDGLWIVDSGGGTPSLRTGPVRGQTGSISDNYAHLETSSGSFGYVSNMTSPALSMPTGGTCSFYYHMYGATIGTLTVKSCSGSTCTTRWTVQGAQQSSGSAAWRRAIVSLPAGTTSVLWQGTRGRSYTGDISVDTISIGGGTAPPSAAPTASPTCNALPSSAFFTVSAASPVYTCGNPNNANQGTCYTTSSGNCFTDGPGNYGNNERCTINILQNGYLSVQNYASERNYDAFRLSGSSAVLDTIRELDGLAVTAGQTLSWATDGSVVAAGFTICGSTSAAPTPGPQTSFSCDFNTPTSGGERFWCGMDHSDIWRVDSGGTTPSQSTGPSSGQRGDSTDNYAHIEASFGLPGRPSNLSTPLLSMPSGGSCTFYYHMYGATIGTLRVLACSGSSCSQQWSRSGRQHLTSNAPWTVAAIALPAGTTRVIWQATRGSSFTGDISIDSINITQGNLPPSPAPTALPACAPLNSGAWFVVTAAAPVMACGGGGGPTNASQGTCFTTSSGNCVTDGPGNYGNNEVCTISVRRTGRLIVVGDLNLYGAYFTLTGSTRRLATVSTLNNLAVRAGQELTWQTSSTSLTQSGYTLCGTNTNAPTAPPPPPANSFSCGFNSPGTGEQTTVPFPTSQGTRFWCGMSHSGLWQIDEAGSTPSTNTGPGSGQQGGTDNYAHIETSYGTAATSSILSTPPLNMPSGGIVSFYYHMFGRTIGRLSVSTCAGTTCTVRWQRVGAQQSSSSAAWSRQYINLPAGTTSVTWNATKTTSFTGDISVDTIAIGQGNTLPPSPAPTATPPCAAQVSGGFFVVSAATPTMGCTGGGGPTSEAQGTCYTTSSGTCFTDGPGNHGDNERCTIAVRRSGFLTVAGVLALEPCCDYFTISGSATRRNTVDTLNGVSIQRGQTISWRSDASVTFSGFTICATTTAPPTMGCNSLAPQAFFQVSQASPVMTCQGGAGPTSPAQGTCFTTSSGTCFTDGPGNHGNNERCTINVLRTGRLVVVGTLQLETCCDYFTIDGARLNTVSALNNRAIFSGQTIAWRSDGSVVGAGYTLCATTQGSCATAPSNAFFNVTAASPVQFCVGGIGPTNASQGTCYTTSSGACVTNGPGLYGNNERCTIAIRQNGFLSVVGSWSAQRADYFTLSGISSQLTSSTQLSNQAVSVGQTLSWYSGASGVGAAFTICGSTTAAPTPAPPPPLTSFSCGFNSPTAGVVTSSPYPSDRGTRFWCNMTHTGLWTVDSGGGTPSLNTGPSRGQAGTLSDNYAHLETSFGNSQTTSTITSPIMSLPTGGALSFYYHMYGATTGLLSVQACVQSCATIWQMGGQQQTAAGAPWRQATIALPAGTTSVRWVGIKGTSFTGDMSIDTISITQGSVPPSAAPTTAPTTPQCPALAAGAHFVVTAATPVYGCSGRGGPQSATQGTCFTTSSGTCFTDGPGDHGNNERCTITVQTNSVLYVSGTLDLERCCDYFTITGSSMRRNTLATLNGQSLSVGTVITWRSDSSITNAGFTLCATPPPPCDAAATGAAFVVTSSSPLQGCIGGGGPQNASEGSCYTTSSGNCFTDGPGNHANNEACTIGIQRSGYLSVVGTLSLERCCDFFTLSGSTDRLNTQSTLDGLQVTAGQNLTWQSDFSIVGSGYTICHSTSQAPTPPPPPAVTTFSCGFNTPNVGLVTSNPFPTSSGTRFWCNMTHTGLWTVDGGGGTPSLYTGPIEGQAGTVFDNYAHIETTYGTSYSSSILTTPPLNLPSGGSLSYYYHMYGHAIGQLSVSTCAGNICTVQQNLIGQQQTAMNASWRQVFVSLPAGTTSVYWNATKGTSYTGDISIDTINIVQGTAPPSVSPTSAPTLPQCGPASPGAFFRVTASSPVQTCFGGGGPANLIQGSCHVTSSGTCVTDGFGAHDNNERCTISILRTGTMYVVGNLSLETCCDYFTISGDSTPRNTMATLNGVAITAGQTLSWQSDFSITNGGYTLCASATAQPTPAPPAPISSFFCGFNTPTTGLLTSTFPNQNVGTRFWCNMTHTGLWGIDQGGTTGSQQTGPLAGQSGLPTDNYAYLEASFGNADTVSLLSSPSLSLPRGGSVRFYYHMFGRDIGSISASACSSLGCTRLWSQSGQQQTSSYSAWISVDRPLPAGTTYVMWNATRGSSFRGDISIDSISISEIPATDVPTQAPTTSPTDVPTVATTRPPTPAPVSGPTIHPCSPNGGINVCTSTTFCNDILSQNTDGAHVFGQGTGGAYFCQCRASTPFRLNSWTCSTAAPTNQPSNRPTLNPTMPPSFTPTTPPSSSPSIATTRPPTPSPVAGPTNHPCVGSNSCQTPSTYCSDLISNTTAPIVNPNSPPSVYYVCECNVLSGYTTRLNRWTCASAAPTTAVPTMQPTSAPNTESPTQSNPISSSPVNLINAPTEAPVNSLLNVPTTSPVTTSPAAPTQTSASSGGGGGGGGSSNLLLVAIIIGLIVIVALVAAAMWAKKRNDGGASVAARTAFNNPLYADDSGKGNTNPLYDDAVGNAGASDGYMDLPSMEEQTDGYMDLPSATEQTDGYMDMAPEEMDATKSEGMYATADDDGGNNASGYMDLEGAEDEEF